MVTIDQHLTQRLVESGFFENPARVVVERFKGVTPEMAGRWNDPIDGYPAQTIAGLWVGIRREALEYIKENMPQVWFRPLFDDEMARQIGL